MFNPDTQEPADPDEFAEATYPIKLNKVGFEYGDCQEEQVTGEIYWYEIQYTRAFGVQKVSFEDDDRVWELGFERDG